MGIPWVVHLSWEAEYCDSIWAERSAEVCHALPIVPGYGDSGKRKG